MMSGGEMRVSIDRTHHQAIQQLAEQWFGGCSTNDFTKTVNQIIFLHRFGGSETKEAAGQTASTTIDEFAGLLD